MLARFLEGAESVVQATDGENAIFQARDFDPSVIFLDAEMPGLDGFTTAARLRAAEPKERSSRRFLVGLSSHDDEATRAAFLSAGCDLVLVKPVTRSAVLGAIEKALEAGAVTLERAGEALEDATDPDVVVVDADIHPMIPAFLESRREQARQMERALAEKDLEHARGLAHKLRGGLEMCGFLKAGALSRKIEEALTKGQPLELIVAQARTLSTYLHHVRYESSLKQN